MATTNTERAAFAATYITLSAIPSGASTSASNTTGPHTVDHPAPICAL